jgi:DNA-binding transcriptional regulator YiaG
MLPIGERVISVKRDKYASFETKKRLLKIDASTIGGKLKQQRIIKRLKQSQLAKQLGISQTMICHWETNKAFPGRHHHNRLLKYLGYSPFTK